MGWLRAWVQALMGPPMTDPWRDDPTIVSERGGQHERINKVTRYDLERQQRERRIRAVEDSWRRKTDPHD